SDGLGQSTDEAVGSSPAQPSAVSNNVAPPSTTVQAAVVDMPAEMQDVAVPWAQPRLSAQGGGVMRSRRPSLLLRAHVAFRLVLGLSVAGLSHDATDLRRLQAEEFGITFGVPTGDANVIKPSESRAFFLYICLDAMFADFSCASACNPPNPSANTVKVSMEDLAKRVAEEQAVKEEEDRRRKAEEEAAKEAVRQQREKEAEERRRKEQEEAQRARLEAEQREKEAKEAAEAEKAAAEQAEKTRQEELAQHKNEVMAWIKKQGFTGINNAKKSFFSSTYPLHKAAEVGNAKMVKLLLEQGANPALKNSAGKTAQEVVLQKKKGESHKEAVKRVVVLSVISSTYYICAFIARLLLGQYTDPGDPNSPDELWSGCSQLIIELSIPACGYYGALYTHRTLLFFFCGANLIFVVAYSINFLRYVIRMGGGAEACALEAYATQQRDCELMHSDGPLRYLFLGSLVILTWFSCLSFGAGKGLYQGLAPGDGHPYSSVPVVGEVIATPEGSTNESGSSSSPTRRLPVPECTVGSGRISAKQACARAPGLGGLVAAGLPFARQTVAGMWATCHAARTWTSRTFVMAGVAGSLLFDAAPDARAEEEIDFTKVLRTGKTPYAKMDYQVFREGKCEPAQMGDLVRVKHRAWLENFEEGLPWELTLVGRMEVGPYQTPKRIKVGKTPLTAYDPPSLTDAILGMRPGELRRVVVPPEFGFGPKGRSVMEPMEDQDIPPNATLYYEIEMVWTGWTKDDASLGLKGRAPKRSSSKTHLPILDEIEGLVRGGAPCKRNGSCACLRGSSCTAMTVAGEAAQADVKTFVEGSTAISCCGSSAGFTASRRFKQWLPVASGARPLGQARSGPDWGEHPVTCMADETLRGILVNLGEKDDNKRKKAEKDMFDHLRGFLAPPSNEAVSNEAPNINEKVILLIANIVQDATSAEVPGPGLVFECACRVRPSDVSLTNMPSQRTSGLVALSILTFALEKERAQQHAELLTDPVLVCFSDEERSEAHIMWNAWLEFRFPIGLQDSLVRYKACEAFYNIAKVIRAGILRNISGVFDGLCRLYTDVEQNIKEGAQSLDRLIRDIVMEQRHFDFAELIPLITCRIHILNPNVRQLVLGWIVLLDSLPQVDMISFLPHFLEGLFSILASENRDFRMKAQACLESLLEHIRRSAADRPDRTQQAIAEAASIVARCCRAGGEQRSEAVLHNNLAGKGPDGGSEGLVFLVSQESHGVVVRDLKISLHALSRYHPAHPHWNGLEGEFASINQFGGRALRVRIHVSDVADKPVRLDYLPIFICDLETDSVALREYVWAYGPHQAYWSPETEIGLDTRGNITEYWQQVVSAAAHQKVRRTVTLVYRHVGEIELAFGSEAPADVTRTFFFAFVALDGCDMELVTSSTLSSTATQSTSTSTTSTTTTPTTSSVTRASLTLTTSTASTITSSYTTSTRTSATFTSTTATAVFGIPLFAPPGELRWWHGLRELSRLKRATLYSVALLGLVLLLVLYWLCWACRAREETGHEMRVLLRL
ncbi:VAC14, partial [Symbiodinium sp. CCMP2456]